jgi:vanillate O-demethylase monooxygenase subunit
METERTPLGLRFTRWMLNSVPPPTYVKAVGFEGRIDRCQRFEFVAPGSVLQWTGADEAGAYRDGDTSNSKLEFRLFHGLTPETDSTCFYFWSAANGFRQDEPAATAQFFDQVAAAFMEDKLVVEGQQARLAELGESGLVDITSDANRLHMRRTVERLVEEEKRLAMAAE